MLDPLAGTPRALAQTPEGMEGLGLAEMSYLASLGSGDAAIISREFLGLAPVDDTVAFFGASALTARGLLTGTGDALETRSSAALLQAALTSATRWTRLGVLSETADPAVVYFFQCPDLAAIVEPAALATWWLRFGDSPDQGPELLSRLLEERLAANPGTACIVDSRVADGQRHNLVVTRSADGTLAAVADAQPGGAGGTPIPIPEAGLPALLAALMGGGR